ncbi:MAG: CRISPR-associated RAMP protein Csx10 [Candidatus Poribacteria bacterium]|nr:MAG: CRISPR-associated RAMP protein Csx10 [Candidatus Poribacteria bacterium]
MSSGAQSIAPKGSKSVGQEHVLCLRPEGPLRTGTLNPRGEYLDTRSYLPGSVLRGALAEWLKAQGREGEIGQVVQKIRFGNLFPSPDSNVLALPFPLTAFGCKLHRGFLRSTRSRRDPTHGIRDSLLIAVAYAGLEERGAQFPVPMTLRCTYEEEGNRCGSRLERVGGFYARTQEGWTEVVPQRMVQTKVALSRYRRAAQEQMLYRVVGLRPTHSFVGRIWTDDEGLIDELIQAAEHVGIGSLTTRGFGLGRLSLAQAELEPLSERLKAFNEKLRRTWKELIGIARQGERRVPDNPEGTYFSVDLLSPALLTDPHGIPTLKLTLRFEDRELEPVYWTVQPSFVGGFSTAWGLPKPTRLGAARGSVYVFRVDEPPERLVPWLEEVERQGVGDRTEEGLGEVLICHPFHREVQPV